MARWGISRLVLITVAVVGVVAVGMRLVKPGPTRESRDILESALPVIQSGLEEARDLIRFRMWDDAERCLQGCLAVSSTYPAVHAALAIVYLGRLQEDRMIPLTASEKELLVDRALAASRQALDLDPNNLEALETRYQILRTPTLWRYDPDGALDDALAILRLDPERVNLRLDLVSWLLGDVRFRRARDGGRMAYDSVIGLEVAESQLEWLLDRSPVGTGAHGEALYRLGFVSLYMGDFEGAVRRFQQLLDPGRAPFLRRSILTMLGTAQYRLGRYEEAAASFEEAIRIDYTLEAAWLLSLCYDGMNRPRQELPEDLRFPVPDEKSSPPPPRHIAFTEVGEALGVVKVDGAGPTAFADYDGDGDPDILAAGCDTYTALFRNDGDRFVDVTIPSGLVSVNSGFSANLVDYDNDGHLDLYMASQGWNGPGRNILLRNRGDGTFEDRSRASGLDDPGSSFVTFWADFENDGLLDVYVCNGVTFDGSTNQLYRNRGDGTFENVTEAAGLAEPKGWSTIGGAAGDYDRDGDMDIFLNGRSRAPNRLYRNRGDGTFEDVAPEAGVTTHPHNGFIVLFLDYNNDAYPDIWTTSLAEWEASLEGMARIRVPTHAGEMDPNVNRLFRNEGDGTFADVTFEAGLVHPHGAMGGGAADLDNDGYMDVYLGTGDPRLQRLEPSTVYHNNGDGTFRDLTRFSGIGHIGKGHGYGFADFDLDGDVDIYPAQGGFCHGDQWRNPLYRNDGGHGHHWLHVRLRGVQSNRFAVGAQVVLRAEGMVQYRAVQVGTGFGSTDSYPVEFGLGGTTAIDQVEVFWPGGHRQVLRDLPVDAMIEVVEGQPGWSVVHTGRR